MDLMQIRRGLMSMASSQNLLWKSMTLSEDYTTNNTNNLASFLGVSDQTDLGDYYYFAVFTNNSASQYAVDFVWWSNDSGGTLKTSSGRDDLSSVSSSLGRTLNASAGTVINVYKLPK